MRPIVIEGPDGAGKTTTQGKLAQDLNRPWVHTGGSNKTVEELDAKCREQAAQMLEGVILDRCTFVSDPIYKHALGQPALRTQVELNARLWMVNPVIIYCRTSDINQMLHAITEQQKAHKPPEYLERVKQTYPYIVRGYDREMELLQAGGFTIIRYDWRVDDYGALLELVKQCAA